MSAFGGLILTNRGRNLQAKAQAGATLHYTRIALGDGFLGTSAIPDLTTLKNQVKSLPITKLRVMTGSRAIIGTVLTNKDLVEGFYFRELGIFAQDPDLGEILYCYGNAGNLAEYIPADGGADILEKNIDLQILTGNASKVTAVIDSSLVYITMPELEATKVELKKYTDDAVAAIDLSGLATKQELSTHLAEKATTTGYGHTILNPSTNSISDNEAATAHAVKKVMDEVKKMLPLTGGNVTGNIALSNTKAFVVKDTLGADHVVAAVNNLNQVLYGSHTLPVKIRGTELAFNEQLVLHTGNVEQFGSVSQSGVFTDTTTTIQPKALYTKRIPLKGKPKRGTIRRRITPTSMTIISFNTDRTQSMGLYSQTASLAIAYGSDNLLSSMGLGAHNGVLGTTQVTINGVWIDGTTNELVIEMYNNYTATQTLNVAVTANSSGLVWEVS